MTLTATLKLCFKTCVAMKFVDDDDDDDECFDGYLLILRVYMHKWLTDSMYYDIEL